MGVASLVSGLNNERMELTDFFVCLYKFMQIKRSLKIFRVGKVQNGCNQCVDWTLL